MIPNNTLPNFVDREWNFSREVRTQTNRHILLVTQSGNKLQVTVKSQGKPPRLIPKHRIIGLPKSNPVPEEFFIASHARVTDSDSVHFKLSIVGGMYNDRAKNPSIVISNIPISVTEISKFYELPEIKKSITSLVAYSEYKLANALESMKTGASTLNIGYMLGRSFLTYGVLLSNVRDSYGILISDTCGGFIDMQTNIAIILEKHILAAKYARLGLLAKALESLDTTSEFAADNLRICTSLLDSATTIRDSLGELRATGTKIDGEIASAVERRNLLNVELQNVQTRISDAEKSQNTAYKSLSSARDKETRADTINYWTLGCYSLFGGKMDHRSDKYEQTARQAANLLYEQRSLENAKLNEISKVATEIAKLLGGYNNSNTAQAAILLAEQAIDEFVSCIEHYIQFIKTITGSTKQAEIRLKSFIDMGKEILPHLLTSRIAPGEIDPFSDDFKIIFSDEFKISVYNWIALSYLGDICVQRLTDTQLDIQNRLRIKDYSQSTLFESAKRDLDDLILNLNKRKQLGEDRQNAAE